MTPTTKITPAASSTPSISCDEVMTLRSDGIGERHHERDAEAHEHRRPAAVGRDVLVDLALVGLRGVANAQRDRSSPGRFATNVTTAPTSDHDDVGDDVAH